MEPRFIHLRMHSEYSLADGIIRLKPLVNKVLNDHMPAMAITDQSNMFATVRFYKAMQNAGIKPIIGTDLWVKNPDESTSPFRLPVLAQNTEGYRNITRLVSRSYREGQHMGVAMVDPSWFNGSTDGVIALSGAVEGDIGRAILSSNVEEAKQRLDIWKKHFPNRFYLELQRTGRENDEICLHECVKLAEQTQTPVVATNDLRFLEETDYQAHEIRVCIHDGRTLDDPRRVKKYSTQQYFRTQAEMVELFSDIPEALQNTVEIAKRCSLEIELGKNYLPAFPIPEGLTEDEYFSKISYEGLSQRMERTHDVNAEDFQQQKKLYEERLQTELDVIIRMGFPGYFLIVADFIEWAKDNHVPVGPGRGSGAGSLVAYAMKITDLDPIEHELLFERFLNPERVSMPDFDIDFCMDKRDSVIDYVARQYGRDSVSQIITYGTMAAKGVVRDVGRVLGHPYGFVDRIAKLIPFEIGMTLSKALEESEELKKVYDSEEEVSELLNMCLKLEGIARNAGKHAGGVVISPSLLTDFSPLYCEESGDNLVTQYDKNDVEEVGLVKFDFLGLRTLTIIDWALQTVNKQKKINGEELVDITAIPVDDEKSFSLLKRCETTAVFQLESRGMKELIRKLQPDCFDEITALVALFRPGPLQSGMVDDFINRKHGRAEVVYPHPELEPILAPTYGVILYQEQVMQIAQVLANYSLGGADLLRRAMGKKKPEEMAKQRDIFLKGAAERNVEEATASYIFDLMEKFAGYGFNKSHSAAYALVSYQTMWMKAHYPSAFMAAVLSADMDNTEKVVTLIEECRDMKIQVVSPAINLSEFKFTVDDDNRVIYGLGAIKGVGESAIEAMIVARASYGKFSDLFEFCRNIDLKKVNRRVLESLIRAGALDELGGNRAILMAQLPMALKLAEQHAITRNTGQTDMFGTEVTEESTELDQIAEYDEPEWSDETRLAGEKSTLGLYLTGHPIDRYEPELKGFVSQRLVDILQTEAPQGNAKRHKKKVIIAGLLISSRHIQTQRGNMASILLDDRTARLEVTLFGAVYEAYKEYLKTDAILVLEGGLGWDDYREAMSLRAEKVYSIDEARAHFASLVKISFDRTELSISDEEWVNGLQALLQPYTGGLCPIRLRLKNSVAQGGMMLGDEWRITPAEELVVKLQNYPGIQSVGILYSAWNKDTAELE